MSARRRRAGKDILIVYCLLKLTEKKGRKEMRRNLRRLLLFAVSIMVVMGMSAVVFAEAQFEEAEIAEDYTTTLEDGEYSADTFTFDCNATGKVSFECTRIIVENGEAKAEFTSSSKNTTHFYMGFVQSTEPGDEWNALYNQETSECGDNVFTVSDKKAIVPVDLNQKCHFAARSDSSAMGVKWIRYTYKITIDEPDWKPTQNQEKSEKIISNKGMVSPAAKGTSLTVNNDGTITVKATTKPMTSNRYSKIAVSLTEFGLENAEQYAKDIDVTVGTAKDNYTYQGVDYGQIPYYWSTFEYKVPVEQIEVPIYVGVYNDLKKVNDATKEYVIDEASASWQRIVTWTIINTPELVAEIRDAAAKSEDQDASSRMIAKANLLDAEAAIAAAKADPTNKAKVQAALAAIDKLTDAQKAALADDIKAVNDAKTAIDKAEKEAAGQAEAAKVKAMTITLKKAKAGKKKITVSWTKNTSVEGYEVYYKTGKKAKTVKITKNSITKKVIKKLKKGKKYTVKVRGYKKINGQMVYTKWSKAKKAKVK